MFFHQIQSKRSILLKDCFLPLCFGEALEFERPTRSWINTIFEKLESKICSARMVDYDRYFACTPDIISLFFASLEKCIHDVPPPLVFGTDELSLEPTLKKKFIVPENISEFISRDVPNQIPHISVMFSHNITGEKIPPFVILPNIQNFPNEIQRPISLAKYSVLLHKVDGKTEIHFYYGLLILLIGFLLFVLH